MLLSPIHFPPMPDPHDHNHHAAPIHTIYNPIVSHAKAKVIGLGLELFNTGGERLVAEWSDLFGDSSL
jgi:hypothetical protein